MSKRLLQEVENWKLEAKLEDTRRYFFHTAIVDKLNNGSKAFVIGRKGTGKTAITEHLARELSPVKFAKKLSFKNFPFGDLYDLKNESFTPPNEYITLWKYLIYSSVAKLMIVNENINPHLRERLIKVYENDIESSLSRTVRHWVGGKLKISILGSGIEGDKIDHIEKNSVPWIERVEILEDILLNHLDDARYFIVFDELDEDYRDMIHAESRNKYSSLLTSLFKAVQDVRSIFSDNRSELYPVVFLRDDIYDILHDPDRTKWNDLKISLDWNEDSIKRLLAFRISRSIDQGAKTLSFQSAWEKLFYNGKIGYGTRNYKRMPAFNYITRSTQLRPRDYVRYFQVCAENALQFGRAKISSEDIKKASVAFSNYLRSELEDEIHGVLPDINKILNLFSRIRKQRLSIHEFNKAFNDAVKSKEIMKIEVDFVLQILFHFSVIGNQPSQKNVNMYRYLTPEARFNQKESIIVHHGLFKSLQII